MKEERAVLGAAFLTGSAGVSYALLWSAHLTPLLGHGAYARVFVVVLLTGGAALGACAAGELAGRIVRPLRAFALAHLALAAAALAFGPAVDEALVLLREVAIPSMPDSAGAVAPWVVSALLVLPQSVLLGAALPLLTPAPGSGGTGGGRDEIPGEERGVAAERALAAVLGATGLGGAAGAIVTGAWLVPVVGGFGALVVAAGESALAGVVAWIARGDVRRPSEEALRGRAGVDPSGEEGSRADGSIRPAAPEARTGGSDRAALRLLGVGFAATAAALLLGVAWTRMLVLLSGEGIGAFEIGVSAFLAGLAGGAWALRLLGGRTGSPLRMAGGLLWVAGIAALLTLPVYGGLFWVAAATAPGGTAAVTGPGGLLLLRSVTALILVAPAAAAVGAALPVGAAELVARVEPRRAVGWAYGVVAFGGMTGAAAGQLVLLPLLGVVGVLATGALVAAGTGSALLAWSRHAGERWPTDVPGLPAAAIVGAVVAAAGALLFTAPDRATVTGAVHRSGFVPAEGEDRGILYYEDGVTATVAVHHRPADGRVTLTRNGIPDGALPAAWLREPAGVGGDPAPLRGHDLPELLAALVVHAHAPRAGRAARFGQGSGVGGAALLAAGTVEELTTVEVEPAAVRASRVFLSVNAPLFTDERHAFEIADARLWLARAGAALDLVVAGTADPRVAADAARFTPTFYRSVRERLGEGGVLGQRLPLDGLDDQGVLSVLGAVHRVFPSYRAYLVGDRELLVVAGDDVGAPDWSLLERPGVRELTRRLPPFTADHLASLFVLDRAVLAPLLDGEPREEGGAWRQHRPALGWPAARARLEGRWASGFHGLAVDRFDLAATLVERRRLPPARYAPPPLWRLEPVRSTALAAWLGEIQRGARPLTFPPFDEWRAPYMSQLLLMERLERRAPARDWASWFRRIRIVDRALHDGTAGWGDSLMWSTLRAYRREVEVPAEYDAAVDFLEGLATWDFERAAAALDTLRDHPEPPVPAALLVDGGVVAYLRTGRVADVRTLLDEPRALAARPPGDLRRRLLTAWIERVAIRSGNAGE